MQMFGDSRRRAEVFAECRAIAGRLERRQRGAQPIEFSSQLPCPVAVADSRTQEVELVQLPLQLVDTDLTRLSSYLSDLHIRTRINLEASNRLDGRLNQNRPYVFPFSSMSIF